jgi:hypothetical protein
MADSVSAVVNSGHVVITSPVAGSYDGQPNIRRDMNRYREKLTGDLKGLARLGSHPRAIDIANILLQQGRVSELLLRSNSN